MMMRNFLGVFPSLVATQIFIGSVTLADQAATGSAAQSCANPRTVEAFGNAGFTDTNSRSMARQEAVRQALFEALQSAGGAEIARSAQTATRSTLTSIERESHEHVVVRSDGRITGWTVVDEQIEQGLAGERIMLLTLGVDLCFDQRVTRPLVVALDDPTWDFEPGLDALRPALSEKIGDHVQLTPATDRPGSTYHDVAITFEHAIERQAVDRRPQADILAQFSGGRQLPASALEFDMVIVRATVHAMRFVDRKAVSETFERRARIATEAAIEFVARDLALEAYLGAAEATFERLAAGELNY